MFKLLSAIPVLGVVLKILNSYAYEGDIQADDKFAGTWAWIKAYFLSIFISFTIAALVTPELLGLLIPCLPLNYEVTLKPGELSTSILPNLLGFGIGAYALVFALDRKLVQDLQKGFENHNKKNKKPGSALLLNTEMALPLTVITITVAMGIFQQIFSSSIYLRFSSWFLLWLSLYFTLDLINNLFMMGGAHISGNLKKENSD